MEKPSSTMQYTCKFRIIHAREITCVAWVALHNCFRTDVITHYDMTSTG